MGVCLNRIGKGITFRDLAELEDIGLISGTEALTLGYDSNFHDTGAGPTVHYTSHSGRLLAITGRPEARKLSLPVLRLTQSGEQLMKIGHFQFDVDYLKTVAELVHNQAVSAKILVGAWGLTGFVQMMAIDVY